jgi:hypothetical protein
MSADVVVVVSGGCREAEEDLGDLGPLGCVGSGSGDAEVEGWLGREMMVVAVRFA